jgi:hypothetical protein
VPEFTFDYIRDHFPIAPVIAQARDSARATMDEIESKGRYTDYLSSEDLMELPIGIKKRMGNSFVTIGISRAKFNNQYADLTVFCKIDLPQLAGQAKRSIFFGADQVRLSHSGNLIGSPTLVLLGDFQIPINGGNSMLTLKGGMDMQTGDVAQLTYVRFNCRGIENMGVSADITFPRNLLVPLKPTTYEVDSAANAKVKGSFRVIDLTDWNDLVASNIALTPFAIKGLEKVAFSVTGAVFDFSDMRTPTDVTFPSSYPAQTNRSLWRGVYIHQVTVALPKEFKKKGDPNPVTFTGEKLIIDNLGLTGKIAALNLMPMGTATGWDFSVDNISIDVVTNNLRSASFGGAIALPISKKPTDTSSVKTYGLAYQAMFTAEQNYMMRVNVRDSLSFDVWSARAKLNAGSYVELSLVNDRFSAKAMLSGTLNLSNDQTKFAGITFQNLALQNESPRCRVQSVGYASTDANRLAHFPITFSGLGMRTENENMILYAHFGINFMENGHNRFSASSGLEVVGKMTYEAESYRYQFETVRVNSIQVAASFDRFKLNGFVNIHRNHPIMGNGFEGSVNMGLKLTKDSVTVAAKLAFGKTTYRYWYAEAMAGGFRLDVVPGVVMITGIGGGAWYNMRKQGTVDPLVLPTGVGFTPDSTSKFGFRAMTAFAIGDKKGAQGSLCLEMTFNEHMGFNKIGLYGKATILPNLDYRKSFSSVSELQNKLKTSYKSTMDGILGDTAGYISRMATGRYAEQSKKTVQNPTQAADEAGSIQADMGIEYDFTANTLHGTFDVYANLAGGSLRGITPENGRYKAGHAELHCEPDANKYYLRIGTPNQRIGVLIGIPNVATVQATAYFMMGTEVPPSPEPPTAVTTILRSAGVNADFSMMRNMSTLAKGNGMAFGTDLRLTIPRLSFGPVYAAFGAGIGFDIMVRDYGDARCAGHPVGDVVGVKGWYASGQAYAHLQGEIGIQVRIFGWNRSFPILNGQAAILLQTKLPNPSWFAGNMAGSYSFLGGRVSGNYRFDVKFGDNCVPQNNQSVVQDVKFIADVQPSSANNDAVDVFALPKVVLNGANLTSFDLENVVANEVKQYRPVLRSFEVTNLANNTLIAGTRVWDASNKTATYEMNSPLPANQRIKVKARVEFEEKVSGNWVLLSPNGQVVFEEKENTFTTGAMQQEIPYANLQYTYPIVNQRQYFVNESHNGSIKLQRPQPNLVNAQIPLTITFTDTLGNLFTETATWVADTMIRFTIPALLHPRKYFLALSIPAPTAENPSAKKSILSYEFNTSRYSTYTESMDVAYSPLLPTNATTGTTSTGNLSLTAALPALAAGTPPRVFTREELLGTPYSNNAPLISATAVLEGNNLFTQIDPYLYDRLVAEDIDIVQAVEDARNNPNLGLLPAEAVEVGEVYQNGGRSSKFPYEYTVPKYFNSDYEKYKQELLNKYLDGRDPNDSELSIPDYLRDMLDYQYPEMPRGDYKTTLDYKLPDGTKTSTYEYIYKY